MNASKVLSALISGHCGRLLAGLTLLGGGISTMASAQDVIAAGYAHSCGVISGQMKCWGANSLGQLGSGTTTTSNIPTAVTGISGTITGASAGEYHTCAIEDGGLKCWGYNEQGQLGNGTTDNAIAATAVPGLSAGVTAVASGSHHTCAVENGGLKCWGMNDYGQLGTGDTEPTTTPVDVFPPGSGVTSVAAGERHTCAISNSELRCWGHNEAGQLGTNDDDDRLVPTLVHGPIDNAVDVSAGSNHSCVSLETGGVRCFGSNYYGQLGNDTFTSSLVPVTVMRHTLSSPPQQFPLSGATSVSASHDHTCASTSSGAYCWGYNESGELGIGSTLDSEFARQVSLLGDQVESVTVGGKHACANAQGALYCWGSDEFGQLGDAAGSPHVRVPTVSITGQNGISAGSAHACGTLNGGAYCWGANRNGQLGNGTIGSGAIPIEVSGLEGGSGVASVSGGAFHSCAVLLNGEAHCWGNNGYSQLGDGTSLNSYTPVAVNSLDDATGIATGLDHSCAVRTGGGVQCWGMNSEGQLGDGTNSPSSVPVTVQVGSPIPIPLGGATAITLGTSYSCAVVNDGARCWGANYLGQLGNGSTDNANQPVSVNGLGAGSDVTMMSAGEAHACAVVGGSVRCWGWNEYGQLGSGTFDSSTTPIQVLGFDNGASAVASGSLHTCAIVDGGVQCWGNNDYGQLGNGLLLGSNVPVTALPAGTGINGLTAGSDFSCATRTTGNGSTTWCWGNGMYGRLGNGKPGYKDVPVEVAVFANGFEVP